jgi:glutathione S-transferase
MAMLDLDARIKPVPNGSAIHAPELLALTGQTKVPVLVDFASGVVIEGTRAVLMHLFEHYGRSPIPLRLRLTSTSRLASRLRDGHGKRIRATRMPLGMLELTGYEASPSTRLVREVLSELEMPYISRQLAAASPRRRAFFARTGSMELPHLLDPNEGIEIVSAGPIIAHLEQTYGCVHASVRSLEHARARASHSRRSRRFEYHWMR